jgi:hypothetical protein
LFIILRGTFTSFEWKNNLVVTPASTIEGAAYLGHYMPGDSALGLVIITEQKTLHHARVASRAQLLNMFLMLPGIASGIASCIESPTVPPPTASLFGSDMNETNNEKVIALKEDGHRRFNDTYGVNRGLTYNLLERSNDELARSKAYVHTGEHKSFTLNKGSISYNHNMKESYREEIKMFASK